MYGTQRKWNARNIKVYYYQEQKEHFRKIGVDEIQPDPEEKNITQRN